jgi:hypothetical protein
MSSIYLEVDVQQGFGYTLKTLWVTHLFFFVIATQSFLDFVAPYSDLGIFATMTRAFFIFY